MVIFHYWARPESVTIIFRSLCLPEIGQLFLPTNQAHDALNGSDMIGSADCRSHVNEPHLGFIVKSLSHEVPLDYQDEYNSTDFNIAVGGTPSARA